MKKLLLTLSIILCSQLGAKAQDVYKEILRLAETAANDKSRNIESRKIATFKVDELKYMAMKTRDLMPDSTVTVLDYQAYAMYQYVNLCVKKLSDAKKKKDKETILAIFRAASIQNPRFHDMDLDLVESYYRNSDYITQFSLDTDWISALSQAREELRTRGL